MIRRPSAWRMAGSQGVSRQARALQWQHGCDRGSHQGADTRLGMHQAAFTVHNLYSGRVHSRGHRSHLKADLGVNLADTASKHHGPMVCSPKSSSMQLHCSEMWQFQQALRARPCHGHGAHHLYCFADPPTSKDMDIDLPIILTAVFLQHHSWPHESMTLGGSMKLDRNILHHNMLRGHTMLQSFCLCSGSCMIGLHHGFGPVMPHELVQMLCQAHDKHSVTSKPSQAFLQSCPCRPI